MIVMYFSDKFKLVNANTNHNEKLNNEKKYTNI